MSINRKVKGAIFQLHEDLGEGMYYQAMGCGCTPAKEEAHVYSITEARKAEAHGHATKSDGKWILVYEDAPLLLPWQQPPVFVHE